METRRQFWAVLVATCGLVGLVLTGCGPKFPKCNTDEDCRTDDKGKKSGRLYCVNGICQQCRDNSDCEAGMQCSAGDCEPIPNYCEDDSACEDGEICENNRCSAGCREDGDCPDGQKCDDTNTCVEKKQVECTMDADCGPDEKCQDNKCVEQKNSTCSLETVYFGYDTANLSGDARDTLESNSECIKKRSGAVELAGHCDERGTNEYNIALGERRARSVSDYLQSLGVSSSRLETISYGEERLARRCGEDGPESCHEQNRRVEFSWQ